MVRDGLLWDFGQVSSPRWASLFSYSLPCLHHQGYEVTLGWKGPMKGIYFEHYPVLFCHTPEDSSSNSPLHLCLHRLLPLPGHTSSGSPHRLGGPVIGRLHGGPLLHRQNCGCAQHVSQTGKLLAEHGACRLRSAGSLTRARTCSWAYLYPTSRTQLVLPLTPALPSSLSGSQCPAG